MADRVFSSGAEALKAAVNRVPRVRLAALPTPLHPLIHLSKLLAGPQLYMKRDDLAGLALGGNKVRKMEFVLADAVRKGADVLITGSTESQANHCAQVAAAAAVLGMRVHLLTAGNSDQPLQGNLLLSRLLGAELTLVETRDFGTLEQMWIEHARKLSREGLTPYIVDLRGDTDILGAIAYVDCALELLDQLEGMGVTPTSIFLASDHGTQAGIELALRALGSSTSVVGVGSVQEDRRDSISRLASEAASILGLDVLVPAGSIVNIKDYAGNDPQGLVEESRQAILLTAQTEGILLDPVYTGRAMAALLDHVRDCRLTSADAVVFIHTGGIPALFASGADLLDERCRESAPSSGR